MLIPSDGFRNILIWGELPDLPVIHQIQIILEDAGFNTFMPSATIFTSPKAEADFETFNQFIGQDLFANATHAWLIIRSCSFDRIIFDEERRERMENKNNKPIFMVDTDDVYRKKLFGRQLDVSKVADALSKGFSHNPSLRTDTILNSNEKRALKKAREYLNADFPSLEQENKKLHEYFNTTRGIFAKAVLYLTEIEGLRSKNLIDEATLSLPYIYTPYSPRVFRYVFISHASQDLPYVRRIQVILEKMRHRTEVFRWAFISDMIAEPDVYKDISEYFNFTDINDDFSRKLAGQIHYVLSAQTLLQAVQMLVKTIERDISNDTIERIILIDSMNSRQSIWTLLELEMAARESKIVHIINIDNIPSGLSEDNLNEHLQTLVEDGLDIKNFSPYIPNLAPNAYVGAVLVQNIARNTMKYPVDFSIALLNVIASHTPLTKKIDFWNYYEKLVSLGKINASIKEEKSSLESLVNQSKLSD